MGLKLVTANPSSDPDGLITEDAAARFLGVSARFLQKHRLAGDGPAHISLGRNVVRYRRSDLKAYAESHLHTSPAAG